MTSISQFHRDMDSLREMTLEMAGLVEHALADSVTALLQRRPHLARKVIESDWRVDHMENELEERCLTLLATQQPVAVDLRFIAGTIRLTRDLERLGDQCVNLSQRALDLCKQEPTHIPNTLVEMTEIAAEMTRGALDALAGQDTELAERIIKRDDDLDALNRDFLEKMITWMNNEQRIIRRGVDLILASRHLERVGDEATNIAETVVFLVKGEIIRHQMVGESSVGPL